MAASVNPGFRRSWRPEKPTSARTRSQNRPRGERRPDRILEERDLQTHLGDDYARYRQQVPMLLPLGRPARPTAPPSIGAVLPPRRGTEPIQV